MKDEKQPRPPEFLKQPKQVYDRKTNSLVRADAGKNISRMELMEFLKDKLGPPPTVSGARRRWNYLKAIAEHIHAKEAEDFNSLVRWMAHSCECMKPRTIREDYVEYLALLGVLDWNPNSQTITWKGEKP